MPARLPALGLLSALLALSGCGMLDAKLKAQTVCFTLEDYVLPGAPAGGPLAAEITYDLGGDLPILSQQGVRYTLALQRLELSVAAASPPVDLGAVETLDVAVVAPPGAALPEPTLVHYARGSELHPTTLTAASPSGDDLAPYVSGGQVTFRAAATGAVPAHAWAADVTGCFLLTVDVNYGEQL
jgi:hypothetical protein